jgi:1-acyl-sn-glycerol-3-phosphate acyltransferase
MNTVGGGGIRLLITALLRVAFRLYFRGIHVQGAERFPPRGAVMLVANHPNSLLDPAILIDVLPRPVHFGAAHILFKWPMRVLLEAFGAVPVYRIKDESRAKELNVATFDRFEQLLRVGRVAALFPEGITQDAPQVAAVKTGAARIALQAEAASAFNLGLTIMPVGLQFEPRRQFRGDAFVRFGEPFTIADMAALYASDPREAARALTERIAAAIRGLAYHVESTDRIPFVERLVDVYYARARRTGIAGVQGRGLRGELKQKMALCLNHYAVADPQAVAGVERSLKRYERLRDAAGIDRRLLEEPARLLPGPLAPAQMIAEAALGAVPAAFGFITGAIPYFLVKKVAARIARRTRNVAAVSLTHVLAGAVAFPLVYGVEVFWLSRQFSPIATMTFALLLVPSGLFALAWTHRMRMLAANAGGRMATWLKLDAAARVAEARRELIARMEAMRSRYRAEVLGWDPAVAPRSGAWVR